MSVYAHEAKVLSVYERCVFTKRKKFRSHFPRISLTSVDHHLGNDGKKLSISRSQSEGYSFVEIWLVYEGRVLD